MGKKTLAEIQENLKKRRFHVVCYMRVDAEDINLMSFEEAKAELENLRLMQPENVYAIEDIDD